MGASQGKGRETEIDRIIKSSASIMWSKMPAGKAERSTDTKVGMG